MSQQPARPAPAVLMSPPDQQMWALIAHTGTLLFGFLAPLLVYLIQGPRGPFVRRHAAEALNFQLSLLIYMVVAVPVGLLLALVTAGIGLILLFPLLIAMAVADVVLVILASLAASGGREYRYPLTIRMVRP